MLSGERSTSSRRKQAKKKPEPATREQWAAAKTNAEWLDAMASNNNQKAVSKARQRVGSSSSDKGTCDMQSDLLSLTFKDMPDTSAEVSSPQNADRTPDITSALRTPNKRRRNVVLDSEDESAPERALSQGLADVQINTNGNRQAKRQALIPSTTTEYQQTNAVYRGSMCQAARQVQDPLQNQSTNARLTQNSITQRLKSLSPPVCQRESCKCCA